MGIRRFLFLCISALMLAGGGASFAIGYALTSKAVIGEAQRRAEADLESAWAQYHDELDRVQLVVKIASLTPSAQKALSAQPAHDAEAARLNEYRARNGIDLLTLFDANGTVLLRSLAPERRGDTVYPDPVVKLAMPGVPSRGTVLWPAGVLVRESDALCDAARIEVKATAMADGAYGGVQTDGLLLEAIEPVRDSQDQLIGFVQGGVLLNRNSSFADRLHHGVFKSEEYEGHPVGTVTVFQGDVRIATTVRTADGERAVGTRISRLVKRVVLDQGRSFYDRAFVVNDWYITAYEPIRDPDDNVLGALYVGILERKFLAYRGGLVRSSAGLMAAGIVLSLAAAAAMAYWLSRPIRRLTRTAAALASGDLSARADEGGLLREVHSLNRAFNEMAGALAGRGDQLAEANRRLESSNQELMRINQLYMTVLQFVSHELKSPLASCAFTIGALREGYFGRLTADQLQQLESVLRTTTRLDRMIVDYLNLARIERGEMKPERHRLALLDDVVAPALDRVHRAAEARKMQIHCGVEPGVCVVGDADMLGVVVENLLTNAIKYGKEGGQVWVGHERGTNGHLLRVRNEGPGFSPADREKLFLKFSRLRGRQSKGQPGTGLGLFIALTITQAHGGAVRAESKEGEWAEFVVELPAEAPNAGGPVRSEERSPCSDQPP